MIEINPARRDPWTDRDHIFNPYFEEAWNEIKLHYPRHSSKRRHMYDCLAVIMGWKIAVIPYWAPYQCRQLHEVHIILRSLGIQTEFVQRGDDTCCWISRVDREHCRVEREAHITLNH